jgi:hypothetical protein
MNTASPTGESKARKCAARDPGVNGSPSYTELLGHGTRREVLAARQERTPSPHPTRLLNRSSIADQQRCVVRQGGAEPGWAALGPQLGGTWGTAGDNEPRGQRVFGAIDLGWETAGVSFHTAEATGGDLDGCEGLLYDLEGGLRPPSSRQRHGGHWAT